ncbi:Nn.00g057690.m01.CDS01 [Neocucurbitaria sp. VM-36]
MDFSSSNNANHMDFHRPSSTLSSIDRKPSVFSFDDNATLDSNILDTPVLMSPTTSTQGIFSPDTSIWEDFSAGQFVDRTATSSVVNTNGNNPFFTEQSNNPFARLPPNQAATYGQQSWPVADNSGSRTPTAPKPLNPFGPGDFGAAPFVEQQQMSYHGLPNVRPSAVFPQAAPEQPMSPHTHSDWMAFNQQEMDSRPGPKRMRPNTPPRSFSPRRDGGIRKKNARFDIPAERNLFNIDNLIQSCTNEDDLKELKQQKRLLRNRQAALDSRQRKKKHTEELEEEKKVWIEKMCAMQDEFATMRVEYDALLAEKENWHRESMDMHHMIGQLQFDKEELVRTHTLETGELRKKVSVLTERLEAATGHGMAVAPSTTFTDFASEMDNLNMGNSDWDNYIFVNDFASDEQTPQQNQDQPLSLVSRSKDEDKPVASGLLLMLLLCGAFVASKSGNAAPPIPRMPDEVRAASATVLDSIFKDAGVSTTLSEQGIIANRVSGLEPTPSGVAWPKTTLSGSELAGISGSHLDQLHSHLTGTTKEQEHEQLFSITPAQYNSMTSLDFTRQRYSIASDDLSDPLSPGSQPSHRRNLAESLAAMREQNKGESAAEIYTRSLLWDKIAPEVVHEFKRIVEESAAMSRPSTSDGTKVENIG